MNFFQSTFRPLLLMSQLVCNNSVSVRNKWPSHRMIKDNKRRILTTEWAPMRLRVNSIRKNDTLPSDIREEASKQIHGFPRDSTLYRCNKRCALTARGKGTIYRWRISRFVFRHLADYNKLAGIQRAMW